MARGRAGGPLLSPADHRPHPHGDARLDHAHDHGRLLRARPRRARAPDLERAARAVAVPRHDGRHRRPGGPLRHRRADGPRLGRGPHRARRRDAPGQPHALDPWPRPLAVHRAPDGDRAHRTRPHRRRRRGARHRPRVEVPPGPVLPGAARARPPGMVRSRKRPALDWGLRLALTGTAFLVAGTLAGLGFAFDLLSGPRAGLAYAALALGGWASLTIIGTMLKVVPFLVWYHAYASLVGKAPVPTLAQLSWPAAERAAYWLLTGGMTLLAGALAAGDATWIRLAGAALAAGALAFVAALARVLHHLAPCGGLAAPVSGHPRTPAATHSMHSALDRRSHAAPVSGHPRTPAATHSMQSALERRSHAAPVSGHP